MASRKRSKAASARKRRPRSGQSELYWVDHSDEQLLKLRFCDLGLRIDGTLLEQRVQRLYEELEARGLRFRPHCWLSSDWFSPDGVPGLAIPFYLAHPRLMQLEERQVLDVEGGTKRWCMQLLRHEAGHALDSAYRLHRRQRWRQMFGKFTEPYSKFYQPKPYSKSYVLHLDLWYAQSHPAEDWAETFAVWLDPNSRWRKRYRGWRALKKLEYVDEVMNEIAGKKPAVTTRERVESLPTLKQTLGKYYADKKQRWGVEYPSFYDRDLRRIFTPREEMGRGSTRSAAAFLRKVRPELRRAVAYWTGEYQYTIDQVLKQMIERCIRLDLAVEGEEAQVKQDAMLVLTIQTMNYLHGGHHRLAR